MCSVKISDYLQISQSKKIFGGALGHCTILRHIELSIVYLIVVTSKIITVVISILVIVLTSELVIAVTSKLVVITSTTSECLSVVDVIATSEQRSNEAPDPLSFSEQSLQIRQTSVRSVAVEVDCRRSGSVILIDLTAIQVATNI